MAKHLSVQPPAQKYQAPMVHKGQNVLWFSGSDASESSGVGVVVQVGNESLALIVHAEGMINSNPLSGVRHRDHPDKDAIRNSDVGCWDFNDHDKAIMRLLEASPAPDGK